MFATALTEGAVWSLMWMVYVYLIMRWFPWEMLHDYPEDVQKASTLPIPTAEQKKKAKLFSAAGALIILGTLMAFGLIYFGAFVTSFLNVFVFMFIIGMFWNVIDLLVMDWLIVCTITPGWVVIPGTEQCTSFRRFGFHFKGFVIGCLYTTLLALVIGGIDFALLSFLVWK